MLVVQDPSHRFPRCEPLSYNEPEAGGNLLTWIKADGRVNCRKESLLPKRCVPFLSLLFRPHQRSPSRETTQTVAVTAPMRHLLARAQGSSRLWWRIGRMYEEAKNRLAPFRRSRVHTTGYSNVTSSTFFLLTSGFIPHSRPRLRLTEVYVNALVQAPDSPCLRGSELSRQRTLHPAQRRRTRYISRFALAHPTPARFRNPTRCSSVGSDPDCLPSQRRVRSGVCGRS
nr:hypothetical protein CFP56_10261 [Quercus suber]